MTSSLATVQVLDALPRVVTDIIHFDGLPIGHSHPPLPREDAGDEDRADVGTTRLRLLFFLPSLLCLHLGNLLRSG